MNPVAVRGDAPPRSECARDAVFLATTLEALVGCLADYARRYAIPDDSAAFVVRGHASPEGGAVRNWQYAQDRIEFVSGYIERILATSPMPALFAPQIIKVNRQSREPRTVNGTADDNKVMWRRVEILLLTRSGALDRAVSSFAATR